MPSAVSTVTGQEVQLLIAKLNRAAPLLPFAYSADVPLQDLANPQQQQQQHASISFGNTKKRKQEPPKHIRQLESITNHLQSVNLCQPGTTFCELGCGTAKLSDHVSETMKGESSHILIDRKISFGHTRLRDRAIAARCCKKDTSSARVERITMDIGDIDDLAAICCGTADEDESSRSTVVPVVISKHLCGPASDLSIQCCAASRAPMVVATCCHYLCSWSQFSNTSFFETMGFTERDFQVLTIVSQWASMNKTTKDQSSSSAVSQETLETISWLQLPTLSPLPHTLKEESVTLIDSKEFEKSFSRDEKAALGKRCKLFLDTARAYRMQELGYRVKLVRYTTMSIEDHLLIALPNL
jgi:hypothetical protein